MLDKLRQARATIVETPRSHGTGSTALPERLAAHAHAGLQDCHLLSVTNVGAAAVAATTAAGALAVVATAALVVVVVEAWLQSFVPCPNSLHLCKRLQLRPRSLRHLNSQRSSQLPSLPRAASWWHARQSWLTTSLTTTKSPTWTLMMNPPKSRHRNSPPFSPDLLGARQVSTWRMALCHARLAAPECSRMPLRCQALTCCLIATSR